MASPPPRSSRPRASKAAAKRGHAPRGPGRPGGAASGAERREKLLDTAIELFARQGIVDTPLAAIARKAGVTPAMLNYYFKSREQLLDVLIDERLEAPRRAIGKVFDADADDPVAAITQLTRRIIAVACDYPWFPALWMREVIDESGTLRQRMQQRYGHVEHRAAYQCIARWQAQGKLNRGLEPALLMASIVGLTLLPLVAAKAWRSDPLRRKLREDDIARHAVALLSQGVRPGT